MSFIPDRLLPGRPYPLGATARPEGVNFAVFSAHAERIDLCLFDPTGRREIARLPLPDCTDEVFHGFLPEGRPGLLYGLRATGPYQPEHGHRFNPHKLLLDPYARQIFGDVRWSDSLLGYRVGAARADLSIDRRDSAPSMPKAVVPLLEFTEPWHPRPATAWRDTVIYEAHVRGLTHQHNGLDVQDRGTFAGLAHPVVIEHMVKLGITAVELLPVHAFLQDQFLTQKGLRNYWGYSTLGFFAPERRYLASGDIHEVRQAIARLHAAGIEVILDVVYNHTCEGSEMGPTLSWRGLDNASYYRLMPGQERHLINDTGTGNTINISHRRVLQMVLDSLRHWAHFYQVDGFRFDLGSTLGREATGFDPNSGFFDAVLQDPVLSRLKLISEPWDIGPGGYQLGNHPPGFAEWNDRFRDAIRRFVRGDAGQRAELAARLTGSGDVFGHQRRKTWASINFVAAHDGFTLHDLASYNERHNEANGEDNRDGHGDNHSANWGAEGPTDDAGILMQRERVKRAMLSLVFFAHGTPMLLAGDEMCRTQQGNNNAYCQDNPISWVDWSPLLRGTPNAATELMAFTARLIAIRRAWPALRSGDFMHGAAEPAPGIRDISWFDEQGNELTPEHWNNAESRLLALRRAAAMDDPAEVGVTLLLLNAGVDDREFRIAGDGLSWRLLSDSVDPAREAQDLAGPGICVGHHGAVLLGAIVRSVS